MDSTTTNLDDSSGEDYETDTDTYNSDSDYSWMSVLSISTANENSDLDSDCEMADVPIADVPMPPPSHDSETVSNIDSTSSESDCNEDDVVQKSYRLCGDNIDKSVKHRYMRLDQKSQVKGFHYFNSYATKNRTDSSSILPIYSCNPSPRGMALTMLPSSDDDSILSSNIGTIVSRVLVNHVPFFTKTFSGTVTGHIPHQFSKEMSLKSEIVSLNVILV